MREYGASREGGDEPIAIRRLWGRGLLFLYDLPTREWPLLGPSADHYGREIYIVWQAEINLLAYITEKEITEHDIGFVMFRILRIRQEKYKVEFARGTGEGMLQDTWTYFFFHFRTQPRPVLTSLGAEH